MTLDLQNWYVGEYGKKGGSDPLFSPGLRPEKRHGVAPALLHRVMHDVLARAPRTSSPAEAP